MAADLMTLRGGTVKKSGKGMGQHLFSYTTRAFKEVGMTKFVSVQGCGQGANGLLLANDGGNRYEHGR